MYGQRIGANVMATVVGVASWWMWGVTLMLAAMAVILLGRTTFVLVSNRTARRP